MNASDRACQALAASLPTNVIQVKRRARVRGRLHPETIATCPGIFHEIRGEVEGIGPWWLEIWRNNAFWRRIRHPRDDSSGVESEQVRDVTTWHQESEHDRQFAFDVEAPGEYTLHSVTDSTQCSARGTGKVAVIQQPAPDVRLQQEMACDGGEVAVDVNASGPCVVTVMASGWAQPREIDLGHGDTKSGDLTRVPRSKVPLFASGEITPGQYTITHVRDALCSASTSQTVTVYPRPEILMRGSVTHVCEQHGHEDSASLEIRANGGFMGEWNASIRLPSGDEVTVGGSGSEAKMVKVKDPGTYVLVRAFSLRPSCVAVLHPYVEPGDSSTDAEQKGRAVTVKRLVAPRVSISGGGTVCHKGGTGAAVNLEVQVTGGKGPYRIKIVQDRKRIFDRRVISPDGRLVMPVNSVGSYQVDEVEDTYKCKWSERSQIVKLSHFAAAEARFAERVIGVCPGDGPQAFGVRVIPKGSPAPWQLVVLRNKRYHSSGQLANSSQDFVFNTEEVIDGRDSADQYTIDPDSFTDARGCLGEAVGGLRVVMNALPSVEVVPNGRKGRTGTCEDEAIHLKFSGLPPWSVTIQLWGGGSSKPDECAIDDKTCGRARAPPGSTCEISGIMSKYFSLAALKDISQEKGSSKQGVGTAHGSLRTTCPQLAPGQGYLSPGYHVRVVSILPCSHQCSWLT